MDKKNNQIKKNIIEKLKWFHGDEFKKYPLEEDFKEVMEENGTNEE